MDFVDFRMPGVSATCCGVNLADPCTGGFALFRFCFCFAFSVSCKGRASTVVRLRGPLREVPDRSGVALVHGQGQRCVAVMLEVVVSVPAMLTV